jgi:hypothetical protein
LGQGKGGQLDRHAKKTVNDFISKWINACRAAGADYDSAMVKAPTSADIDRLRQFLQRLECDAQSNAGDLVVAEGQVEKLKSEIAYLETTRSRAFLFQIGIDFGAPSPRPRAV